MTLVRYELRRADPLIEPRFFASRPFSAAAVIAVAAFAAFGGFLFLNTLYLQEVRGLSPLSAGLCTLPLAAMTVRGQPDLRPRRRHARGARPAGRRRPRARRGQPDARVARAPAPRSVWVLAAYCVFGLGFGAVNPPITNTAVSGMPPSQAGVAAAVATTSRQVGLTLGVAVLGAVATARVDGSLHDQLAAASHAAWWLIAASGAGIVALGLAASTGAARGQRRADRGAPARGAAGGVMGAAPTPTSHVAPGARCRTSCSTTTARSRCRRRSA